MEGGEALTRLSHHAVPMQIAIGANVHCNLKSHVGVLEGTSHFLPACRTFRKISLEQPSLATVVECFRLMECILPTAVGLLKDNAGENLRFRRRIILDKLNLRLRRHLAW